jgi:hypothetical protein
MTARPVYPVPYEAAMKGLPTLYHSVNVQFLRDLSMRCLIRGYFGGYFRAALWAAWWGIEDRWQSAKMTVVIWWEMRARGKSLDEVLGRDEEEEPKP